MSSTHRLEETTPPLEIGEDKKVRTNQKTLAGIIAVAFFLAGAYWTLQDHGRRIDALAAKVESDHDILVDLRSYMRRGERAQERADANR